MSKVAYVFPGQGSQYIGMGKDLYDKYESARDIFHTADQVLGVAFSDLIFGGDSAELTKTVNAQPALLTMSVACLAAAREAGVLPEASYMAGHSLGEYSALVAAGAMDFQTALKLTRERGRLMFEAGEKVPGTMAAIIAMDRETLEQVCAETGAYLANLNCPGQIAISGTHESVKAASELAKARGAKMSVPLQVSGAFHSPLIRSAADALAPQIDAAEISDPAVPVIGNTGAQVLSAAQAVRAELAAQVCNCVHWEESIRYMLQQGVDTFIEIGPGKVLSGLMKRIDKTAATVNIGSVDAISRCG